MLVSPLRDIVIGGMSHTLWILLGAVAIVMLIAFANVANLFLVRAEARRRETDIRSRSAPIACTSPATTSRRACCCR